MKAVHPQELRHHPETGDICGATSVTQHGALLDFLSKSGVELYSPSRSQFRYGENFFTRDWWFVIQDLLVANTLFGFSGPLPIEAAKCIDWTPILEVAGGDVMVLNKDLTFIGIGARTVPLAFQMFSLELRNHNVGELMGVPHQGFHLDCCFAPLPNGKAFFDRGKLPNYSLDLLGKHFRLEPLDEIEARFFLAGNLLWLNPETVISTTCAPKTNRRLEQEGFKVHAFDYLHIIRSWGSVRCTIAPIIRHN